MADENPTPNADDEKTVPQSEVDRIVKQRLERERAKFADYDEIKARAAKADELEAAGQSELEKLQAQVKKLEQARDQATADAETARTEAQTLKVESAIRAALPKDIVDADAALQLLSRDQVTVGDDGQVTGHEDAVAALLEAKPYLVGNSTQRTALGPRDGGARGPATPSATDDPKAALGNDLFRAITSQRG